MKKFNILFIFFCLIFTSCEEPMFLPDQISQDDIIEVYTNQISPDDIIDGYTDKISYNNDELVLVYLNSKEKIEDVHIKLYTIDGQVIDSVKASVFPQKIINTNPWENGFGYNPTFSYNPSKLKSGMYLWEGKVSMIVKSDIPKDIIVVYPSNTENAYSGSGGKSMYMTPYDTRARIVSFQRPITISYRSIDFLKWIRQTEYAERINYIADIDIEDYAKLSNSKLMIIIGHNEYWTRKARVNFDRFIDEGKDALVLSGNSMWWQVRYSENKNQLICYKDSLEDPNKDPLLETILWKSSILKFPIIPSIGADLDLGGYGQTIDNGWDGFKICIDNSPIFEGTGFKKGDILSIPTHEYDGTELAGFDTEGYPIINNKKLNFYKAEIIGFDKGNRVRETYGTFIIFKKKLTSGIIINAGTTDWCSEKGIGGKDGVIIKIITLNMINKLLNNDNVFSN